jgi:hypothetical protein
MTFELKSGQCLLICRSVLLLLASSYMLVEALVRGAFWGRIYKSHIRSFDFVSFVLELLLLFSGGWLKL